MRWSCSFILDVGFYGKNLSIQRIGSTFIDELAFEGKE